VGHRNVTDVGSPHLIDALDDETAQQIRISAMVRCWPAGALAMIDGLDTINRISRCTRLRLTFWPCD
jgi:hypothetical protein